MKRIEETWTGFTGGYACAVLCCPTAKPESMSKRTGRDGLRKRERERERLFCWYCCCRGEERRGTGGIDFPVLGRDSETLPLKGHD